MMTYLVRKNCEYSFLVEADTADEAMERADSVSLTQWGQAWSELEAEEDVKL